MDRAADLASHRRRRRRLGFLGVIAAVVLVLAVTFRNPWFCGNFGVVDPGLVYRSAQPTGNLDGLVATHRVASILNLRGGSWDDSFYVNELRLIRERGIDFYDLPMSATRRPLRRELLRLIDLFARCRYPLLIHCKSGSDRTGLASGLYLMTRRGTPPLEALGALSLSFGHVPIGGTARLHEPFREYARWLEQHRLSHTPARLRAWVAQDYRSDEPNGAVPPLKAGPRSPFGAEVSR